MKLSAVPPGPAGHILVGSIPELRNKPLEFMEEGVRTYGDIFHFRIAGFHGYQINRPDLVEQVLVTDNKKFIKPRLLRDTAEVFGRGLLVSEGDFWLRQRRLMQPAFHRSRIASYAAIMTDYAEQAANRWKNGQTLDIHEEMMHVTLEIVTKALFGAEIREEEMEEVGRTLDIALKRFIDRISFLRFMQRLPLPSNIRFRRSMERLDAIIYRIIESRRRGTPGNDLLSMLLEAQDEYGDGMSDRQVRDETITLFLAGHETTAIALSWTWYLLSHNPEVEAKLGEELEQVLGSRVPTMEDIPNLPYTGMVVKESMRLYPPAWRVGREAAVDCTIEGYPIPAGSQVIMSQWTLHRDPRYFDEPLRFLPERWADDLERRLPKFAYFPFGGGPRVCIGDSFAVMEAVLILATIARKFKIRLLPEHPIEYWPSITLRPRYGMKARVLERQTEPVPSAS